MSELTHYQKGHIYRTIVLPLLNDINCSGYRKIVLTTDVKQINSISQFIDTIYKSKSIGCYSELKANLGTAFLSNNKQKIFRYIKEQLEPAPPAVPKPPFSYSLLEELKLEISDCLVNSDSARMRFGAIINVDKEINDRVQMLNELLSRNIDRKLYNNLCDVSTESGYIKDSDLKFLVTHLTNIFETNQEETNMSINNQTPIIDLPIIVKGIDIRDTDVESLIQLLNQLNSDQEKYEKLGESKYATKALKKVSQAKKCVIRELDKKEP